MSHTFYDGQEKLLVATDCIIFGFDDNTIKLLLFQRKVDPLAGAWSLIGSFVKGQESVRHAAARVLEEYTGLQNVYMEELGCFGDVGRDPGARVISIAFSALIRIGEYDVDLVERHGAHWFDFDQIPQLVLDHNDMAELALQKLRRKAKYQPLGFELLPQKFTIPQLQTLYECIYQRPLDKRNFRRKILSMNILEKLDEKDKLHSKKGAYLYKFDPKKYQLLVKKGILFEL